MAPPKPKQSLGAAPCKTLSEPGRQAATDLHAEPSNSTSSNDAAAMIFGSQVCGWQPEQPVQGTKHVTPSVPGGNVTACGKEARLAAAVVGPTAASDAGARGSDRSVGVQRHRAPDRIVHAGESPAAALQPTGGVASFAVCRGRGRAGIGAGKRPAPGGEAVGVAPAYLAGQQIAATSGAPTFTSHATPAGNGGDATATTSAGLGEVKPSGKDGAGIGPGNVVKGSAVAQQGAGVAGTLLPPKKRHCADVVHGTTTAGGSRGSGDDGARGTFGQSQPSSQPSTMADGGRRPLRQLPPLRSARQSQAATPPWPVPCLVGHQQDMQLEVDDYNATQLPMMPAKVGRMQGLGTVQDSSYVPAGAKQEQAGASKKLPVWTARGADGYGINSGDLLSSGLHNIGSLQPSQGRQCKGGTRAGCAGETALYGKENCGPQLSLPERECRTRHLLAELLDDEVVSLDFD